MAEIPAGFELTKRPRIDGRLDLVGVQDDGKEYVARTTEHGEVTEADVKALADGDRTRVDAYQFTGNFVQQIEQNKKEFEDQMLDDYMEPAERVAFAGFHRVSVGYSRKYSANYEKVFR
jgi:hypothetical protein